MKNLGNYSDAGLRHVAAHAPKSKDKDEAVRLLAKRDKARREWRFSDLAGFAPNVKIVHPPY